MDPDPNRIEAEKSPRYRLKDFLQAVVWMVVFYYIAFQLTIFTLEDVARRDGLLCPFTAVAAFLCLVMALVPWTVIEQSFPTALRTVCEFLMRKFPEKE